MKALVHVTLKRDVLDPQLMALRIRLDRRAGDPQNVCEGVDVAQAGNVF